MKHRKTNVRLLFYTLVQNKLANPKDIALLASEEFGLPVIDLAAFDFELIPQDLVSTDLIDKHRVLPLFKRGNRLYVGQSDPSNFTAIDEIKFNTGMNVEPVVVEEDKLSASVTKFLASGEEDFSDFDDEDLDLDIENPADKAKEEDNSVGDDAPIVKFVNKMLLDAIKGGSSDIHFEPYEKRYRVRFRTDGVLHEVSSPPINLAGKIAARIKVMSQMIFLNVVSLRTVVSR